jgi:hypothetical protein
MAIDSTGTHLYVSTMGGGTMEELIVPSMTRGVKFTLGGVLQGIAVTKDGSRVVIVNEAGFMFDIKLANGIGRLVLSAANGFGLADAPSIQRMFWTSGPNVGMYVVPQLRVAGTLKIAGSLRRIAYHEATNSLIVADAGTGVIWFVR